MQEYIDNQLMKNTREITVKRIQVHKIAMWWVSTNLELNLLWISTSALGGFLPVHWVDIQSTASIPAAHSNVVAGCGPGKWFPQVFGICLNRVF